MTRREMAFQGVVAFGVVVGIVGGNFVLHRWMLGNTTSREVVAGATTITAATPTGESSPRGTLDEPDFAAPRRAVSPIETSQVAAARRVRLIALIADKLPNASSEEQAAWFDQLQDVEPDFAAGILNLRQQFGPLSAAE